MTTQEPLATEVPDCSLPRAGSGQSQYCTVLDLNSTVLYCGQSQAHAPVQCSQVPRLGAGLLPPSEYCSKY